jgi:hypothetical protein
MVSDVLVAQEGQVFPDDVDFDRAQGDDAKPANNFHSSSDETLCYRDILHKIAEAHGRAVIPWSQANLSGCGCLDDDDPSSKEKQ